MVMNGALKNKEIKYEFIFRVNATGEGKNEAGKA